MAAPPHEKLDAHNRSLEALAMLEGTARWIPAVRPDLRDQLQRTAASIVLNLAEGASEFSPSGKARCYRMARRSAAECLAILDVLKTTAGPPPNAEPARKSLEDVMAMVTRLVQAVELRKK